MTAVPSSPGGVSAPEAGRSVMHGETAACAALYGSAPDAVPAGVQSISVA